MSITCNDIIIIHDLDAGNRLNNAGRDTHVTTLHTRYWQHCKFSLFFNVAHAANKF